MLVTRKSEILRNIIFHELWRDTWTYIRFISKFDWFVCYFWGDFPPIHQPLLYLKMWLKCSSDRALRWRTFLVFIWKYCGDSKNVLSQILPSCTNQRAAWCMKVLLLKNAYHLIAPIMWKRYNVEKILLIKQ